MGQIFAFKEPIIPGAVAPVGPPGGKATTQLLAGDRGSQWVAVPRLGWKSFPLLSLKWYMRGGGGEDEDPAWRVPPTRCPRESHGQRQGSPEGRCPEMAGGL